MSLYDSSRIIAICMIWDVNPLVGELDRRSNKVLADSHTHTHIYIYIYTYTHTHTHTHRETDRRNHG